MTFAGPVEDRLAIRELAEAYGDAVYRADADGWVACWAEDAVWTLPGFGEMRGRAAIVEAWRGAMSQFEQVCFHTTIGALAIDQDRAEGRCYTSEVLLLKGGGVRRMEGAYDDRFVKQNGVWLFAARAWRILADSSAGGAL
jgi:uncharacterized protein (TIGR02246 family)